MKRIVLLLQLILAAVALHASAATWTIHADGSGDAPTIQAGIDAAADGDTIGLADGTYTGPGNGAVEVDRKSLVIRSLSGDPEQCVIDCQGEASDPRDGVVFYLDGEQSGVVEGLTVMGASSNGIRSRYRGDWERIAQLTVRNCHVRNNRMGIMSSGYLVVVVSDCVIADNQTSANLWLDYTVDSEIRDCVFEGNQYGVGFTDADAMRLVRCRFVDDGGAYALHTAALFIQCDFIRSYLWAELVWRLVLSECSFTDSPRTAAVMSECLYAEIKNCRFVGSAGYGLYLAFTWWPGTGPSVENCLFAGNERSGILLDLDGYKGPAKINNCTIYGNGGSGIELRWQSTADITNTIVAANRSGHGIHLDPESLAFVQCSNFYGHDKIPWVGGKVRSQDVVYLDPQFCDADAGDFSLAADSPCRAQSPLNPCGALMGVSDQVCANSVATGITPIPEERRELAIESYPNPFNPETTIRYTLPHDGFVTLRIYDALGRLVRSLVATNVPAGEHVATWRGVDDRGRTVATGVYFARLTFAGEVESHKLVMMK